MSSTTALGRLRKLGYGVFYSLPPWLRRRLVRLGGVKYVMGAVALVKDSEAPAPGRILLLRQPPGVRWSLPAGLLAHGEQPIEGCARELREESGISLSTADLTPATPNAVVHSRGKWVDVVFEASVPASTTQLRVDGAEVLEAGWHRLDGLPALTRATANLLGYYGIGPYADRPETRR
jgi:ADP-ribose pyrophosphatase YjhB (NUDIX family)